jgi:hypothetical protein
MGHKRKPTPHQKQIRFFVFFFGALVILIAVGIIVLMNQPWNRFH